MVWNALEFRGGGLGNYSLSGIASTPAVKKITAAGEITIGGTIFDSLQYNPDCYCSDYLNISFAVSATSIVGVLVDFFYTRAAHNVHDFLRRHILVFTSDIRTVSGTRQMEVMSFLLLLII